MKKFLLQKVTAKVSFKNCSCQDDNKEIIIKVNVSNRGSFLVKLLFWFYFFSLTDSFETKEKNRNQTHLMNEKFSHAWFNGGDRSMKT